MAVVNGPQFPKLTFGRPWPIGIITTATDALQFSFSRSSDGGSMGSVAFHFLPNGTLATTPNANLCSLQLSLDGGVTWHAQKGAVGGSAMASTTGGTLTADQLNFSLQADGTFMNLQIPSVAGSVSMRIQVHVLTFGTATQVTVYGLVA